MNPITIVSRLITARRRAAEQQAQFIAFLRQLVALLEAGRPLTGVWPELAEIYPTCATAMDPMVTDPGCCLHHVIETQHTAVLLGTPYFQDITGPGATREWQQLAATIQLAQHTGMSLAQVLTRLADALEAGQDAEQARQAASAGPKSTANLLAWLPVAGLGLAHMMGATLGDLISSITGWVLLTTGIGLAVAGRIWSARMIRTAQEL